MKQFTKWFVPVLALAMALPIVAMPQGRWNGRDWGRDTDGYPGYGRIDNRDEAYRAGYNQGFSDGEHQGRSDSRVGRHFNEKARDLDRFGYGFSNSRFRNDFKKGFRKGYREGYRAGYQQRGRRWF
jgi:hypothetical protein